MNSSRIRLDFTSPSLAPHTSSPLVVGWQEKVSLPNFGSEGLIAKIDSGALCSSLHAVDIQTKWTAGSMRVSFKTNHPHGWSYRHRTYSATILDVILVRSSHATVEQRYVIETPVKLGDKITQVRFGLTDRSAMKFALLLGRDAIQSNYLIDCSRCFLMS